MTGGGLRKDGHLGRLRGKAGHSQAQMVHGVWYVSEAGTLEEHKGMRLQRLPITDVWHARLRRRYQRLWVVRSQGLCELGGSMLKDPGLGKDKCDGGTRGGKS